MNPKVKKKFLAALRRPDTKPGWYKQTRGQLHGKFDGVDCFCALGVLRNLAAEDGLADAWTSPFSVSNWAGVGWDGKVAIIRMNDVERKTFPEIADWVEKHL